MEGCNLSCMACAVHLSRQGQSGPRPPTPGITVAGLQPIEGSALRALAVDFHLKRIMRTKVNCLLSAAHLLMNGAATDRSHPVASVPLLPCSSPDCFCPCLFTFFSDPLAITCTHAEPAKPLSSPGSCLTWALLSLQALLCVTPCLGQEQLYSLLSLQQELFSLSSCSESRVPKAHGGF